MRQIDIIVPLTGISTGKATISTEASGFVGGACKTATEAILKSLGGSREEQLKDEYYVQDQAVEHITDGSGPAS